MKSIKGLLPLGLLGLSLGGCLPYTPHREGKDIRALTSEELTVLSQSISYFKEGKTGLCFAVIVSKQSYPYNGFSIANVPCDKVSKEIK
jgi:hypothetical protein